MNRPRVNSGNAQTSCKRKVDPDFGMQAIKMREGSAASRRTGSRVCSPREASSLAKSAPFCRKTTAATTSSQPEGVYNGLARREEITPSGVVRRLRNGGPAAQALSRSARLTARETAPGRSSRVGERFMTRRAR